MDSTKPGTSIKKPSPIQSNHLLQVLDSKSEAEWLNTELSSGTSTSEDTNTDSESTITTQMIRSNGGPLMLEPRPSDHGLEETMLLLTKEDKDSESMLPLLLDNTLDTTLKESNGTVDQEETSETMVENA